ncbi:hypothetical protein LIA77_04370 [Sarocladium implicatum]|nr:hypothetical protein LIA77_04370 [Sarocladium implicatum]
MHSLWLGGLLMFFGRGLCQTLPVSGLAKAGFADRDSGLRLIRSASYNPNATDSIAFNRTYNGTVEEWRWGINITDFAVPNDPLSLGIEDANSSEGLRVANTQWQLDWPSSSHSTLDSLMRVRDANVHFTFLITNKPSRITDGYSSDGGGDCAPILGEQCADSLKEAAKSGPVMFSGLAGCEDSLIPNDGGRDEGIALTYEPPAVRDRLNDLFRRRHPIFYKTSPPYTADNLTEFNRSLSALHVFIMDWVYDGNRLFGEMSGPTVLCRIVDPSVHQDREQGEQRNGQGIDEDGDDDGDEGDAVIVRQPITTMLSFLTFSIIVTI